MQNLRPTLSTELLMQLISKQQLDENGKSGMFTWLQICVKFLAFTFIVRNENGLFRLQIWNAFIFVSFIISIGTV